VSVDRAAKHIVRESLRRLGFTVERYSPATVPDARIAALLAYHKVDLVLDVGANAGQYARALRRSGYRGRILSFEPLRDAWARCAAHASRDPLWTVAPRMALGSEEGEVEIHVAANSASSSILPMRESHRAAAPDSAYIGREIVDLRRLDRVVGDALDRASHPFLKMDTQGYEREILAGAAGIMAKLRGIQMEISLAPLYEGSPSFHELLDMMKAGGFVPWAILPGFTDQTSGRMLQVDGLFFLESPPAR
jgi:FkbM family methyltransferase